MSITTSRTIIAARTGRNRPSERSARRTVCKARSRNRPMPKEVAGLPALPSALTTMGDGMNHSRHT